ncbi:MAG TPA: phosphotransferase [Marmoricola sp.]|nr:phosphotransferase [Marmoricola sp.]
MDALPATFVPLPGGHSGESFLAEVAGEQTVVRIYGPRSARRGPLAPEVDAAVLRLVRGLLPVAEVLEVRRAGPAGESPGLLVTSRLPGERLEDVLPGLDRDGLARVGGTLGTVLGRLGHMAMPRPGAFVDRDLTIAPMPREAADLRSWVEHHRDRLAWPTGDLDRLRRVADRAQPLLDLTDRCCLVHSDFNPKNVLVDPETLDVTGLVDWEYAHSGSPYADLGNLLRFERDPSFADAVVAGYSAFLPARAASAPDDLLDRARAADLFALVDLAARRGDNPVAARAHDLLLAVARTGDLAAVPG